MARFDNEDGAYDVDDENEGRGNRPFSESENSNESGFQQLLFKENERVVKSLRGIILESINVLYRAYGVNALFHFRQRIFRMETKEELEMAAKMLEIFSRFQLADPAKFDKDKLQGRNRD